MTDEQISDSIKNEENERIWKKLEDQAFAAVTQREQRQYQIEADKRLQAQKAKAKWEKQKKAFLEAAFDGELQIISSTLMQVENDVEKMNLDAAKEKITIARKQKEVINFEDPNDNTPLSEAASGGQPEIVEFLLKRGAEINKRGHYMRTPLWRAAFAGHGDVVRLLLENGGDPRMYASDGQRPADVAAEDTIKEMIESWNIEFTERLLEEHARARALEKEEVHAAHQLESEDLQARIDKVQDDLQQMERDLDQKKCLLKQHIENYDTCGSDEGHEIARSAINFVELEIESALVRVEKQHEDLDLLKLKKRETDDEARQATGELDDIPQIHIRELEEVLLRDVGEKIAKTKKWPLVMDQTSSDQTSTFLRYRDVNYLNCLSPKDMQPETIRMALLGSIRYGKPFVLDMMDIDIMYTSVDSRFGEVSVGLIDHVLNRDKFFKTKFFFGLIRESDGPEYAETSFSDDRYERFSVIVLTRCKVPSEKLLQTMHPLRVVEKKK